MCKHETVEQVRGKMGLGDYFDAITNSLDEPKLARLPEDYHEHIELHDDNRSDTRIVCKKCFLSTGWMKVDFPGATKGLGLSMVRAKWEEMKDHTVESWNDHVRKHARKTVIKA